MARIDDAQERLECAVARLERAQTDRIAQLKEAKSTGPDSGEMNNLIRALKEAQRENAALVAEREAMADRVDMIIGRLRTVAGMKSDNQGGDQ